MQFHADRVNVVDPDEKMQVEAIVKKSQQLIMHHTTVTLW